MFIVMLQFYSPTPAPDMHEMAKALRNWGHRVWVGTPDPGGDFCFDEGGIEVARLVSLDHNVLKAPSRSAFTAITRRKKHFTFMLRVRRFLDKIHPDVVQVNPFGFAFVFPICRRNQAVYVLDVRQAGEGLDKNFLGRFRNWRTALKHRLNARYFYHHTCFASAPAAERILGRNWRTWATIHRVGQDPSFISYQWDTTPPPPNNGPIRFVYIGSIARIRQLELLLEAVRAVSLDRRDFSVDFIGPDQSNGFYHDLVEEWEIGDIVKFLPAVPYSLVAETIATYDVALAYVPPLPDWQYQPTLKVLEYRALGMPIIASDNPANRLIVEHGENGLLVEHCVMGIVDGIRQLLGDRALLARLTKAARNKRLSRTWEESAREYLDLVYVPYISTLNKTKRAPKS